MYVCIYIYIYNVEITNPRCCCKHCTDPWLNTIDTIDIDITTTTTNNNNDNSSWDKQPMRADHKHGASS